MTGQEHYREAEALLASLEADPLRQTSENVAWSVGLAQVHATLALAAATADTIQITADRRRWAEAQR